MATSFSFDWRLVCDGPLGKDKCNSVRDGGRNGPLIAGGLTRIEAECVCDAAMLEQYKRCKRLGRGETDPARVGREPAKISADEVEAIIAAGLNRVARYCWPSPSAPIRRPQSSSLKPSQGVPR